MQVVDLVLPGPRHDLAERSAGVVVGENPCGRSGDPRRAAGKARSGAVLDAEIAGDERPEPDVEESRGALGLAPGIGGGYDDFLRRPYRRSNRSMRPPESTSFCLPV